MSARVSVLASRGGRLAAILLICGSVQAQRRDDFIIVNSARPVGDAVMELMKRHPVVITYEDPRYTYAGDLKDVTEEIRNPLAPPNGQRTFVPVGGELSVRYEVSSATNQPANLQEALETLVEAKAALPAGGRFRVEQSGSAFHVIASQVRDASGQWVEHTSVLDVPITLKTGELNGILMVSAILNEVSARNGVEFSLEPMSVARVLSKYTGVVEANDEPAREVLLRTLQQINDRLTWSLNYYPRTKGYIANVFATSADPTIEINGEPRLSPRPGDPTPTGPPIR